MDVEFDYKLKCLQVHTLMQTVIEVLFSYGINIGIEDELRDLPQIFSTGDPIEYDLNLLKALEDPLIGHIVQLIGDVEHYWGLLIVLNDISLAESAKSMDQKIGVDYWPKHSRCWEENDPYAVRLSLLEYLKLVNTALFCHVVDLTQARMSGADADRILLADNIHEAIRVARRRDRNITLLLETMQALMSGFKNIGDCTGLG